MFEPNDFTVVASRRLHQLAKQSLLSGDNASGGPRARPRISPSKLDRSQRADRLRYLVASS